MREILFRGKWLDNGEWIKGDLRHGGYYLNDKEIYICVRFADTVINYPVDPATVGQYTGLRDKNGKKIFEGDIVKITDENWIDIALHGDYKDKNTVVVWKDWAAGFFPFADYDSDCDNYCSASECEVIGNIHDNTDQEITLEAAANRLIKE